MTCSNIRPLLSAYYDGDATAEERAQVETHLAGCPDCRHALAEFRAIGSDIRSLSMPQPPAGLRRDVWRAIETQQTNARIFKGAPGRGVVTMLPQPKEKSPLPNILIGIGRNWAAALPAAVLIGVLLVGLSVILLQSNPVVLAEMMEKSEITSYAEPVHAKLYREVNGDECEANTHVSRLEGSQSIRLRPGFEVAMRYDPVERVIAITPLEQWQPGARYEVFIDAPKIGLIAGAGKLGSDPIILNFNAGAYTPTPTSTPTITPTQTNTPVPPTNTPQPTAVAENTPLPVPTNGQAVVPTSEPTQAVPPTQAPPLPSATSAPRISPTRAAQASPTPGVNSTNTAGVPPTSTPVLPQPTNTRVLEPTLTQPPVSTPTARVTNTPAPNSTATPTPIATSRKATPTSTPTVKVGPSPTATATPTPVNTACDLIPLRGFGKVWQTYRAVRDRIGCPEAREMAIPQAAVQHFQGGKMVWRADLKLIYVFINGASRLSGTWVQFPDTWQDTDTPVHATGVGTPPAGLYEPVRGFGKLWNTNGFVRQSLSWATDREAAISGAWQKFEHGEALWTSDRDIHFMYDDDTFQQFEDTFVGAEE